MTKARDLADLLDSNGNLIAKGVVDGRDLATDGSKLDGIEAAATADQDHSEIRALITIGVDTNVFTDADHTKLDGIEASATADQTDAEIRAAVEAATDSNVFTDADHTKLNAIEASATADQTNAEIRTAVESATDSNVFTDADHTKLNAIEAGATADQTKSDIDALNINADTLDGQHGSYYTGYTDTAVANIVDSSPAALNTLNELAAALGDDPNFATTTSTNIGTKLPKAGGAMTGAITTNSTFDGRNVSVDGAKLDGIEAGANVTDTANVVAALTAGSNITISAGGTIAGAAQYTHPTHPGDDAGIDTGPMSGATVISDLDLNIFTDTLGHVTDANATVGTRNLTLANLGYTGATNANNFTYSHPTYNGDDFSVDTGALSGATVVSDIDINVTTDGQGHVTDANGSVSTRNLTLANLGYTGATNANYITNNNQLTNGAGYTTYTANQAVNTTSAVTHNTVIGTQWVYSPGYLQAPNMYIDNQILHNGDTDTYMQFHAADQWRVVAGGNESLEVRNGVVNVDMLEVGGTDVISSSRQLQNIASVDATTAAAIGAAGVGGAPTFLASPPNFASPTTTYSSSGTYSRGSTSSSQLLWIYLVGGGNGGGHSNIGEGGNYRFVIVQAGTLNGSSYTIGAGGTSGGSGGATSITIGGVTYSTANTERYTVHDGAMPAGASSTYVNIDVYTPSITNSGYTYSPHSGYSFNDGSIFSGGDSQNVYYDGSASNSGFGKHSLYAGNAGNSRYSHGGGGSLPTYNNGPHNGIYPGGGGGSSYNGGSSNGAAGNMRIYHV